jgi:hypothetical protein
MRVTGQHCGQLRADRFTIEATDPLRSGIVGFDDHH